MSNILFFFLFYNKHQSSDNLISEKVWIELKQKLMNWNEEFCLLW